MARSGNWDKEFVEVKEILRVKIPVRWYCRNIKQASDKLSAEYGPKRWPRSDFQLVMLKRMLHSSLKYKPVHCAGRGSTQRSQENRNTKCSNTPAGSLTQTCAKQALGFLLLFRKTRLFSYPLGSNKVREVLSSQLRNTTTSSQRIDWGAENYWQLTFNEFFNPEDVLANQGRNRGMWHR